MCSFLGGSHDLFLNRLNMPIPYYLCTGQKPEGSENTFMPVGTFIPIIPLFSMVGVYVRMRWHKRNAAQAREDSIVEDVESNKLSKVIQGLSTAAFFAVSMKITSTLQKLELHELNQPPYSYMSYYRSLVNIPLGLLCFFLLLIFNRKYFQSILDELSELKREN